MQETTATENMIASEPVDPDPEFSTKRDQHLINSITMS